LKGYIIAAVVLVLLAGCQVFKKDSKSAPEGINLAGLLDEMVDRDNLARFPDPAYSCMQFSSYDRKSITAEDHEGWFANYDRGEYLRTEENGGRKEWVMMDAGGPGAVVRIWSANPAGNLRVYLDHNKAPVIEAPMNEILGGTGIIGEPLSAVRSKGYNLYLPIPYAKHCKITSDAGDFYYQINYRTYEQGTRVATLTPDHLDQAMEQIAETGKVLLLDDEYSSLKSLDSFGLLFASHPKGGSSSTRTGKYKDDQVAPGESLRMELPEGPMVVKGMNIAASLPPATLGRSIVLEASFDGIDTIWCPLSDFAGIGVGTDRMQDYYRVLSSRNVFTSMWPMPYKSRGEIRITNHGDKPVKLSLKCHCEEWDWDDRSMHFYARWRYEHPIPTRPMSDWNYVNIKGKGVYVGDTLTVMNPSPIWWGEGDEKFYIDGEAFPSHFGTGTEDYYGYAWCYQEPFLAPFHGQPRCDGSREKEWNNFGYTTVSRVRSLDAIPFEKSLDFDMEVWHWRDCEVAYGAVTFFYARPGATHNRVPQPGVAAEPIPVPPPPPPPFKIEGALECEGMEITAQSKEFPVSNQNLEGLVRGKFSDECHLFVQATEKDDFVEIRFPAKGTGSHRITLYATCSWDYGIVRFYINGKPAGEAVDLYSGESGKVKPTGPIDLGAFEPEEGFFSLRAVVVGGNPDSEGTKSYFGLDCIVLELVGQEE
jgi:hypothetical protein